MTIFSIISILLGLVLIELAVVGFAPWPNAIRQPLTVHNDNEDQHPKPMVPKRDVSFEVGGLTLGAWYFRPDQEDAPFPCIVLVNGFGGTKSMLLAKYAGRFRDAGFAVLAFDFRFFGESQGEPRQFYSYQRQLEDCAAAVDYARSLAGVDPDKIALWGTSAGGGHVVIATARDERIACAVAQCPGIDHAASSAALLKNQGILHFVRLFFHGQRDIIRSRFGLSPHRIPIVGRPGTTAFFSSLDAFEGYSKLADGGFINEVCARVFVRSGGYRPDKELGNLKSPLLVQICDHDSLAPLSQAFEERLKQHAEVLHYPVGHFDIYRGETFEQSITDQIAFFQKHLLSDAFRKSIEGDADQQG